MDELAEAQSRQPSVDIAQLIENRISPDACMETEIYQSPVNPSGDPGHFKWPPGISGFLGIWI